MLKKFVRNHEDGLVMVGTMLMITVMTGILITASGKTIVVELDGLNSSSADGDGNIEEHHVDGGRFKLYAE